MSTTGHGQDTLFKDLRASFCTWVQPVLLAHEGMAGRYCSGSETARVNLQILANDR